MATIEYLPENLIKEGVVQGQAHSDAPKLKPTPLPVNKIKALAEFSDLTFFTPAIPYCICEQHNFKLDPLTAWVPQRLWKYIGTTRALPGKLYDAFTGSWAYWNSLLLTVPTALLPLFQESLAGRGFLDERTGKIWMITFNTIHVTDVVAVVYGKLSRPISVLAMGIHSTTNSTVLADKIVEGDPELLSLPPDRGLVELGKAFMSGDSSPFRAVSKSNKGLEDTDVSVRQFEDLKPSYRKKLKELAGVYRETIRRQDDDSGEE